MKKVLAAVTALAVLVAPVQGLARTRKPRLVASAASPGKVMMPDVKGASPMRLLSDELHGVQILSRDATVWPGKMTVQGLMTINSSKNTTQGTPVIGGNIVAVPATNTFTDNATANSGTAANFSWFGISQPTLAATNTSVTTTVPATLYIGGAPIAGTNETLTATYGVYIDSAASVTSGATTAYGLYVKAPTGATTNYALGIAGGQQLAPPVTAAAGFPVLTVTPPADTALTLSTEFNDAVFQAATKTWATGALTTERQILVSADTLAFAGGSTVTTAATWDISGAPVAGTNATITTGYGLRVEAGAVGSGTATAFGGWFGTPTGATTNEPLAFQAGTSTANEYPVGMLQVSTASNGNGGTCAGNVALTTYTLPANALSQNGKGVRITSWGTTANNATAKTIQFFWGSQSFLSKALAASVAGTWKMVVTCYKTGSSTQACFGDAWNYPASTVAAADGATVLTQSGTLSGTQTDTSAIVLSPDCITNANAANDIVQTGQLVEFVN